MRPVDNRIAHLPRPVINELTTSTAVTVMKGQRVIQNERYFTAARCVLPVKDFDEELYARRRAGQTWPPTRWQKIFGAQPEVPTNRLCLVPPLFGGKSAAQAIEEARRHIARRRYEDAQACLDRIPPLETTSDSLAWTGCVRRLMGEGDALQYLDKAVARDPSNCFARLNRVCIRLNYQLQDHWPDADLSYVLTKEPNNQFALILQVCCRNSWTRLDELRSLAKQFPNNDAILGYLGDAIHLNLAYGEEGTDYLLEAFRLNHENPIFHNAGRFLNYRGRLSVGEPYRYHTPDGCHGPTVALMRMPLWDY